MTVAISVWDDCGWTSEWLGDGCDLNRVGAAGVQYSCKAMRMSTDVPYARLSSVKGRMLWTGRGDSRWMREGRNTKRMIGCDAAFLTVVSPVCRSMCFRWG